MLGFSALSVAPLSALPGLLEIIEPPVEVVIQRQFAGDPRKLDEARDHFERKQDEDRDALRAIIENAFQEVAGTPVEPVSQPIKREIARAALPVANMDGIKVSLNQIMRLVNEYEAQIIKARQDDEDELFMLMAA